MTVKACGPLVSFPDWTRDRVFNVRVPPRQRRLPPPHHARGAPAAETRTQYLFTPVLAHRGGQLHHARGGNPGLTITKLYH